MSDLQLNECPPNSLVMRVLSVTAENDSCQDIFWRVDDQYAPISIFVNCNDVFWWGCSDAEAITADNLDIFEQAYRDAPKQGGLLFCCRVRGMRPQGAYYKYIDNKEKPFFDACGPEREISIGNPLPQNAENEESL